MPKPFPTLVIVILSIGVLLSPAVLFCQAEEHMTGMRGFYGDYPVTRDASGTSWQPESTPMPGVMDMVDDLSFMYHGFANGGYIVQQGKRGDDGAFTTSMLSVRAQHPLEDGIFGIRTMLSLDPLNGGDGYPLLLQTGETANGRDPLLDRQHPHELFSELAMTFSWPLSEASWGYVYAGYPGEPALGPPSYMDRFSGMDNPVAPLGHHWMDSTHTVYGVITGGYTNRVMKLEGSLFDATEPDQNHWNMEFNHPRFRSYSGRAAFNLSRDLVWDFSVGRLSEPEQLHEGVDIIRLASFVSYNVITTEDTTAQLSLGWGRDDRNPGKRGDAFIVESAVVLKQKQTYFTRLERVDKDELFGNGDPRARNLYTVYKAAFGYIYDFPFYKQARWGVGASVAAHFLPQGLKDAYGKTRPLQAIVFARLKL